MKLRLIKTVLWFLVGLAMVVVALRILHGVGSVVALDNILPWGLWKGGGVVALVPIGGAGFTLAAFVYVFHWKRYAPLARGAVLLGLMCYTSVAVGLTFDIGIWWRIVYPVFHWQAHSALFEIAWCIMLYLGVLVVEFSHTVVERLPYPRLLHLIEKVSIVFVILGISLSTLHQSSLGTLFLATPYRLHPLWYSEQLPVMFFITAVGLGCLTISWVTLSTHWLYGVKPPMDAVSGLARISTIALSAYLLLRFGDMFWSGNANLLFVPGWDTANFWFEIVISAIVPIGILSRKKWRENAKVVFWVSTAAVVGMSLNRVNVAGLATLSSTEGDYFPVLPEWAVTAGVLSAAALAFLFAVERVEVFKGIDREAVSRAYEPSRVDHADWKTAFFRNRLGDAQVYSAAVVVAIGLAAGCLPDSSIYGVVPEATPVAPVKSVKAQKVSLGDKQGSTFTFPVDPKKHPDISPSDVLLIDGDGNGRFVLFDHTAHITRRAEAGMDCRSCHHMTGPLEEATSCGRCHSDMHEGRSIFDHDVHQAKLGGNEGCIDCHTDTTLPKVKANTTSCESCHPDMRRDSPLVKIGDRKGRDRDVAPGYTEAMHGLCITCHKDLVDSGAVANAAFAQCVGCHQAEAGLTELTREMRVHAPAP
jgi:Ni/Fe-hydrogenase subunit HybB-like protein